MKLIVLPTGADLDALSSAYGVLLLHPDAKLLKPAQLSKSASAVFKHFKHLFEDRLIEEPPEEVETLVLVDTCSFERLPYVPRYGELLIYDHHPKCFERKFENTTLRVDRVGAATTLVVEEIKNRKVELSPEGATLLLMGIYEDTGNFTHLGTTPRDLEAAAFLLSKGGDLQLVDRFVNERLSAKEVEVVYKLLRSIEYVETPKGERVAIATFKGEEYFPDFQEVVYKLKEFTSGVDGFFIVYEAGNKTYIFGRAVSEKFDAADILRRLGGGGHREAASLKVEGITAERIKKRLIDVLTGKLPDIYLEHFMSREPLVVKASQDVKEALRLLVDYGFAGAPVVNEKGKPLGVVFKKELLKALKHLGEKPLKVEEIYNPDVRVLHLKSTIWEAENILSRFGQKLIPVVDDSGKVVGVITRLDIFKNILSETPAQQEGERVELPPNIKVFAEEVGRLADELGVKAYIVGGVVRDILLGRPVWDIDIVVEGGSAVELAKAVAQHYGVKLHEFDQFGTAHLKVGSLKVEFATARRERYERSGAYPEVEPATLKEDLLRRDFTINTLAIALNRDRFGALIDYLGGVEDLQKGVIRVLHSLSFVEDPIRILRALRFAGRFGFELSKGTKSLLRRAVELGVLKRAPKGRIANELRLALREEKFIDILDLYREYKILEQILPEGFRWSKVPREELKRLKRLLEEFPKIEIPGWVLFVSILQQFDEETGLAVLKELSAPAKVREIYTLAKRETGKLLKALKGIEKPSDLVRVLKKYPPELLLMVASKGDRYVEELIRFYLKEVRPFKVKVDVEKFKREGLSGKELGKAIEEEKLKVIDQTFGGKFQELLELRGGP